MTTLLHSATAIDERGVVANAWLLLDGDRIAGAGSGAAPQADDSIDLAGCTITPGFVDLHGHGGGGHAFDDGGEHLRAGLAAHRVHGTTRSVVSLVSNPLADLRASLESIAALADDDPLVLGAHLEGPFLAPDRRGAHHIDALRTPDALDLDGLLHAADGRLRQITIAPELPGALDAVERLAGLGVVVAVGHTDADADTARAAFDRGATLLTHAFNGMPGIHHRHPGPVLAALRDERVTLELILDGHHVHPDVVRLAVDEAPGRVAFVTDSMAAAGSADGYYALGRLNVTVSGGLAVLSGTTTFAGSTLTQDMALRNAIALVGMPPAAAVAALTAVPARVLGLGDSLGLLAPGYAADVVVLDADWRVQRVWADGREFPKAEQ